MLTSVFDRGDMTVIYMKSPGAVSLKFCRKSLFQPSMSTLIHYFSNKSLERGFWLDIGRYNVSAKILSQHLSCVDVMTSIGRRPEAELYNRKKPSSKTERRDMETNEEQFSWI